MMIRYKVWFNGRVQRVGFRIFVSRTASAVGLTGYVKNLADGRVEAEVQGENEGQITAFLRAVRAGNGLCKVKDYDISPIPAVEGETSFSVY